MSWKTCTLDECISLRSGSTPSKQNPSFWNGTIPWASSKELKQLRLYNTESRVTQEAIKSASSVIDKGTVLIVVRGMVLAKEFPVSIAQVTMTFNQDLKAVDPKGTAIDRSFLPYLLLGHREGLRSLADEAAHGTKRIQTDRLLAYKVELPSPEVQKRIASILSTYDDLIENNTRRIEILEEMARRLYEEWFVQFRFPGHEGLAFENDVPQGWSRVRLDSVAVVNPEAISPKNAPDEIMYVDISSVSTRQVNKLQRLEFSEAPGRARRKVVSGDVVWSCVRPGLRSYALIIDPPPNTIVSTGFAVVRADSVPFSYLYQVLGSDQFVSYLDNHATGAAYPAVKASDFEAAEVVLPCKNLLAQFDGAVLPMLKMIHVLRLKNNNLQSQRDLLLPKLISGEIDISDIPMPT